jgi:protein gp37
VSRWPLPNVWLGVSVEDRASLPRLDTLRETPAALRFVSIEPLLEDLGRIRLGGIDWVIVGGESGPGARPFDLAWARSTVQQCRAGGVPVFVKQLGAKPYDGDSLGHERYDLLLRDRKGADPAEWPEDLRVREFPRSVA